VHLCRNHLTRTASSLYYTVRPITAVPGEPYLKDYQDVQESVTGLGGSFAFYNHERLPQSLDYRTPAAVYRHGKTMAAATTFN
jgi:hypothetical protein